jgi:hypothetical protein
MPELPRCDVTDLLRVMCDHCRGTIELTPDEQAFMAGQHAPPPMHRTVTPKTPRHHVILNMDYPRRRNGSEAPLAADWQGAPVVLICDHGHDDQSFMCQACSDKFRRIVADVPRLMHDLEVAHSKQVTFLDTGAPKHGNPDEAPLDFNPRASKSISELARALGGDPVEQSLAMLAHWQDVLRHPDLPRIAGRISGAVKQAHQTIEHPPEVYDYGLCPSCGERILQERITAGVQAANKPGTPDRMVTCPHCGNYAADIKEHQRTQILRLEEEWRTVAEVLEAMRLIGEPITRHQLDNMIYRDGLPRETRSRPRFSNGILVSDEVFVYRLKDIREVQRRRRGNPVEEQLRKASGG